MKTTCLVLIAHGSKDPEWASCFKQFLGDFEKEWGKDKVFLCFLENLQPDLMEVARQAVATGHSHCRVLPMFMGKGSHFRVDIPRQMTAIKTALPALELELLLPIGQHPLFFDLMRGVIKTLLNPAI